jgi:hypothetical protein
MKKLILIFIASLLTACGGGGGGGGTTSTTATTPSVPDTSAAAIGQQSAEGLWNGTANAGGLVKMLVQSNGAFFQFYGTASPSGQLFGTLRVDSNNNVIFDTSHGKINGVFEQSKSISATTVRTATTLNFTMSGGSGNTRSISQTYDSTYSSPFTGTDLVGSYSGVNVGQNSTFSIDANGNISGSIGSCNFSGTITPDNTKRFANVNITTNSCVLSLEGIGKALLVGSGVGAQIYVGTQDGYGYTMYGIKL